MFSDFTTERTRRKEISPSHPNYLMIFSEPNGAVVTLFCPGFPKYSPIPSLICTPSVSIPFLQYAYSIESRVVD